ncbi:MAG: AAA family ATPase [Candidatus Anstonellales archaeon]
MMLAEKYRPENLEGIVGNFKAVQECNEWMDAYAKGEAYPLVLYGPPGTGKSSAAIAIIREMGWDLVRVEPGSIEGIDDVERISSSLDARGLFAGRRAVLFDDVDCLQPNRGGVGSILKEIMNKAKEKKVPLIMTLQDIWARGFEVLREGAKAVKFSRVSEKEIAKLLASVARKEGISIGQQDIEAIAAQSNGDVRAALNSLEGMAGRGRDIKQDMFSYVGEFMRARSMREALNTVWGAVSLDDAEPWLLENAPVFFRKIELAQALDLLALSTLYNARTKSSWKMLRYRSALVAGMPAFRNSSGRINFPQLLRSRAAIWAKRKEMEERSKLLEKHCSASKLREYVWYFA